MVASSCQTVQVHVLIDYRSAPAGICKTTAHMWVFQVPLSGCVRGSYSAIANNTVPMFYGNRGFLSAGS